MDTSLQNRNSSLDFIRILAAFFVLGIHFFLHTGFYNLTITSSRTVYLMCLMRQLYMACVPMFLILSGYLMNRKTLSSRYYAGLIKTLSMYVIVSIITMLYQRAKGENIPFLWMILHLLDFEGAPYAWYIEMYIGLFLIIPFLNLAYHGLHSRKQKLVLVMTMVLITSLPCVTNVFRISKEDFFRTLIYTDGSQKLLPSFWMQMYPLTYYFIGCYLSEYRIQIKNRYLAAALVLHLVLIGAFGYLRNLGGTFDSDSPWQDLASITTLITALLIVLMILNLRITKFKAALRYTANLSLCLYLVSWIFEDFFYPRLLAFQPDITRLFLWHLPIALFLYLCSALASAVLVPFNQLLLSWGTSVLHILTKPSE